MEKYFQYIKRQMVNIHNIAAALQIIKKSDTQLKNAQSYE